MVIEELLRNNTRITGLVGSEYIIRVIGEIDGMLHVTIRPLLVEGESVEFLIEDDLLFQLK